MIFSPDSVIPCWEGYEVWKKRVKLVKCFWKTIAPDDWKINHKRTKSRVKRTLRPNCKNPFHYCKKISDLSMQRRTLCACSDMKRVVVADMDIRNFLTKYPKSVSYEKKLRLYYLLTLERFVLEGCLML